MIMSEEVIYAVFLNLRKAYNALDRYGFLDILDLYDVGLHSISLIHTYWYRLIMVARPGGCYGDPFKGYWGVT